MDGGHHGSRLPENGNGAVTGQNRKFYCNNK
jgi:hypothetical protein